MPDTGFKINPALKPLWEKVHNKKSLYGALLSVGLNAIEKNFDTEGERTGKKWKDLEESTKKARAKKKHWPGKILQDSGIAAQSIQADADNEKALWGFDPKVKYLKTHALGITLNYPARSQVIHFRNITRGKNKGVRFSKVKKASFAQKVLRGAYSYTFPVRNPFQFTEEDFNDMNDKLTELLT
jgi:phage gpG-like protein